MTLESTAVMQSIMGDPGIYRIIAYIGLSISMVASLGGAGFGALRLYLYLLAASFNWNLSFNIWYHAIGAIVYGLVALVGTSILWYFTDNYYPNGTYQNKIFPFWASVGIAGALVATWIGASLVPNILLMNALLWYDWLALFGIFAAGLLGPAGELLYIASIDGYIL